MLAKSRQSILPVTLQLNQPTNSSAHFPHLPQTLIELMSFDPNWALNTGEPSITTPFAPTFCAAAQL
jgi:hypothetical protein